MPCDSARVDGTARVLVGAELLYMVVVLYSTFVVLSSRCERECPV